LASVEDFLARGEQHLGVVLVLHLHDPTPLAAEVADPVAAGRVVRQVLLVPDPGEVAEPKDPPFCASSRSRSLDGTAEKSSATA
jgi:hypothetical protein